jgi:very-short-patch-repair endonuclease
LSERGYRVLRFWNDEVLTNMDGVLEQILGVLREGE